MTQRKLHTLNELYCYIGAKNLYSVRKLLYTVVRWFRNRGLSDFGLRWSFIIGLSFLFILCRISAGAPVLPSDWRNEQTFQLSAPALVKLSLPVETLDKARPALEDLRLYDDAGNELPYLIERPAPAIKADQNAESFQASLNRATTWPSWWYRSKS